MWLSVWMCVLFAENLAKGMPTLTWVEMEWNRKTWCIIFVIVVSQTNSGVSENGESQERMDWMIWPGEGCMLECPPKASIQSGLTEVHQSLLWTFASEGWVWSEKTPAYLMSRGCFFLSFSSLSIAGKNASQKCWSAMLEFCPHRRQLKGQMWLEWPLGKVLDLVSCYQRGTLAVGKDSLRKKNLFEETITSRGLAWT